MKLNLVYDSLGTLFYTINNSHENYNMSDNLRQKYLIGNFLSLFY